MAYQIAFHQRMFRPVLSPLFRFLFRVFGHVTVNGRSNVPARGPYLVVFNHVSIYDPPLMISFWPTQLEILGATEIWHRPGQSVLARLWGAIPVKRGELDRVAMLKMISALQDGRPLLVSPEGTRSHIPGLQQAKSGVVYLIEKTGLDIVPVGVVGTADDFVKRAFTGKRPQLEMNIGPAFRLPDALNVPGEAPRDTRQRKVDYLMVKIAELLPESYRGWYANIWAGDLISSSGAV